MMADLWDDIRSDLASACRHFEQAVAIFREPPPNASEYLREMAFQHAMQAGYTSFETAMRRLLTLLQEDLPVGSDWHRALVERLARPGQSGRPRVITEPVAEAADELRRFRHVAMHAYDRFRLARAAPTVEAAETFLAAIDAEIAAFRAVVDP